MMQKYITAKNSETGKAVTRVLERCRHFSAAEKQFKEKYQIKTVFRFVDQLCGAVCVELSETADTSIWIPFGHHKFIPGKNLKLMSDWRDLQSLSVPMSDIDICIGGFTSFFQCGFEQNEDHYIFTIDSDWDYILPDDLQHYYTHNSNTSHKSKKQ